MRPVISQPSLPRTSFICSLDLGRARAHLYPRSTASPRFSCHASSSNSKKRTRGCSEESTLTTRCTSRQMNYTMTCQTSSVLLEPSSTRTFRTTTMLSRSWLRALSGTGKSTTTRKSPECRHRCSSHQAAPPRSPRVSRHCMSCNSSLTLHHLFLNSPHLLGRHEVWLTYC